MFLDGTDWNNDPRIADVKEQFISTNKLKYVEYDLSYKTEGSTINIRAGFTVMRYVTAVTTDRYDNIDASLNNKKIEVIRNIELLYKDIDAEDEFGDYFSEDGIVAKEKTKLSDL